MMRAEAGFAELPLLVWLSPAFPVGGFAYSHGLEAAVDLGLVRDAASLTDWIADLVRHGSIRQDAILLAAAWTAVVAVDASALADANDVALALCPGRERLLEATGMGNAFVAALRTAWPEAVPASLPDRDVAYPIAVGAAAGALRLDFGATLEALALAFAANLVSSAVRLGVIGQTDGQRVTAASIPAARALAREAEHSGLDDLGGCAFTSDLAALQHETQYSRLFRS